MGKNTIHVFENYLGAQVITPLFFIIFTKNIVLGDEVHWYSKLWSAHCGELKESQNRGQQWSPLKIYCSISLKVKYTPLLVFIWLITEFVGSNKIFEVNKDIRWSFVDERIKRSSYTSFKDSRTTAHSRFGNSAFNLRGSTRPSATRPQCTLGPNKFEGLWT